jgi:hypothetical protein
MRLWMLLIKNLVKSSLDQYVLPGTLTGTEILLLYMTQWTRDMASIAPDSVYAFLSRLDIPTMARAKSNLPDEQMEVER